MTASNATSAASAPNELLLTHITEHKTGQGKALPVRNQGRVLEPDGGYPIDSRVKARLAVDALEMAVAYGGPKNPLQSLPSPLA
jgi:hypothetical protein